MPALLKIIKDGQEAMHDRELLLDTAFDKRWIKTFSMSTIVKLRAKNRKVCLVPLLFVFYVCLQPTLLLSLSWVVLLKVLAVQAEKMAKMRAELTAERDDEEDEEPAKWEGDEPDGAGTPSHAALSAAGAGVDSPGVAGKEGQGTFLQAMEGAAGDGEAGTASAGHGRCRADAHSSEVGLNSKE